MRLLVLGGTWFLGRAIVEEALRRGHETTTFNRGISASDVPDAQAVHGDRASATDLARLIDEDGGWDAVIDTSGYVPAVVLLAARALAGRAARYAFVSSVNAYQGWPIEPLTEASPVRECAPDATDEGLDAGADRYGRLKAGCENAVASVFRDRALVLRPGVILGPYESVGRVPWWLGRIARGGRVLAPGFPERPIQPIDVRDVAAFTIDALGSGLSGAVNVAAPAGHSTFGEFLAACVEATGSGAELEWVDDDFLLAQGVRMWTELPLWRASPGTWQVDASRALAAGLRARPLPETVADTWAWMRSGGAALDHTRQAQLGIDPRVEQKILADWDGHEGVPPR